MRIDHDHQCTMPWTVIEPGQLDRYFFTYGEALIYCQQRMENAK